ncbi:MAG TPA: hypothetical protein VFV13_13200 [Acidimicrobiia bacterium]|nr:hypothetical protein [Acidimicrobiia bacterium]
MKVVVQRSAVKMWLLALGGIPLLVIAVDVLTSRRITNWLRELIFTPEDTQIYEPRDVIWAWAMLLFSAFIVLWGLKELFRPTKVIEAQDEGLQVRLRGPFRKPDLIPWGDIVDVGPGEIMDEGDALILLRIALSTRGDLPEHPWGARWLEPRVLGLLAEDWSILPAEAAEQIADYAVAAPTPAAQVHTVRIPDEA